MTFCSLLQLDLLSQTGRAAAEKATGYAVTGMAPSIDRVWTLCSDGDWPRSVPQHGRGRDRPSECRSGGQTAEDLPTVIGEVGEATWPEARLLRVQRGRHRRSVEQIGQR